MAFFGITALGPQSVFVAARPDAFDVTLFELKGEQNKDDGKGAPFSFSTRHLRLTRPSRFHTPLLTTEFAEAFDSEDKGKTGSIPLEKVRRIVGEDAGFSPSTPTRKSLEHARAPASCRGVAAPAWPVRRALQRGGRRTRARNRGAALSSPHTDPPFPLPV